MKKVFDACREDSRLNERNGQVVEVLHPLFANKEGIPFKKDPMYSVQFPDGVMADVRADELYDLPVDEIWQGQSVRDNLLSTYRYGGMRAIRNHLITRFAKVVDLSYAAEHGKAEKESVRDAMLCLSGIALAAAEAIEHADVAAKKPGP